MVSDSGFGWSMRVDFADKGRFAKYIDGKEEFR